MRILSSCKAVLNTLLLDATESFEYRYASLSGVAELMDRYPNRLAAVSGIPVTRLYGTSPGGLNATGESDIRGYYDEVAATVIEPKVIPAWERVVEVMCSASKGPTGGKVPQAWSVEARPLWEPSDQEIADLRKTTAETDAINIDKGVYTPQDARQRYEGESWSFELQLEDLVPQEAGEGEEEEATLSPEIKLQQARLAMDLLFTPPFDRWATSILGAPLPTPEERTAWLQSKRNQSESLPADGLGPPRSRPAAATRQGGHP